MPFSRMALRTNGRIRHMTVTLQSLLNDHSISTNPPVIVMRNLHQKVCDAEKSIRAIDNFAVVQNDKYKEGSLAQRYLSL